MSKHTKGPWKVVGPLIFGNSGAAICQVTQHRADPIPRMEGETLGNRNLIAAAPELLEALIEACDIMQREIPWNAEKKFRAVIAKAIGSATHTAIGDSEKIGKVSQ